MSRTLKEYLRDIILGKLEPLRCSGYPIQKSHQVVDYKLTIGERIYSYCCPICGFGQGGSLSEQDCNELRELQQSQKK